MLEGGAAPSHLMASPPVLLDKGVRSPDTAPFLGLILEHSPKISAPFLRPLLLGLSASQLTALLGNPAARRPDILSLLAEGFLSLLRFSPSVTLLHFLVREGALSGDEPVLLEWLELAASFEPAHVSRLSPVLCLLASVPGLGCSAVAGIARLAACAQPPLSPDPMLSLVSSPCVTEEMVFAMLARSRSPETLMAILASWSSSYRVLQAVLVSTDLPEDLAIATVRGMAALATPSSIGKVLVDIQAAMSLVSRPPAALLVAFMEALSPSQVVGMSPASIVWLVDHPDTSVRLAAAALAARTQR